MRSLREVYAAYLKAILHVRFGDLFYQEHWMESGLCAGAALVP